MERTSGMSWHHRLLAKALEQRGRGVEIDAEKQKPSRKAPDEHKADRKAARGTEGLVRPENSQAGFASRHMQGCRRIYSTAKNKRERRKSQRNAAKTTNRAVLSETTGTERWWSLSSFPMHTCIVWKEENGSG